MRWWPKRCHQPLISEKDLAARCAAATAARQETAAIGEQVEARAPQVSAVTSTWRRLSEVNHFGETITAALRGRET